MAGLPGGWFCTDTKEVGQESQYFSYTYGSMYYNRDTRPQDRRSPMTISGFLPFIIAQLLMGCSVAASVTPMLRVKMIGIEITPPGAAGNASPISQTYELEKVVLITNEEEIELPLPAPVKVIIGSKPLIIYEAALSATTENKTFIGSRVVFSPAVKGVSRYNADSAITLPSSDILYTKPFTVSKGQDFAFLIQVSWKSTVLRDEDAGTDIMSVPTLAMQVE